MNMRYFLSLAAAFCAATVAMAQSTGSAYMLAGIFQSPAPSAQPYVQISLGDNYGLGLRADGSVAAWGNNAWGQATVPPGLRALQVHVGFRLSAALLPNGRLRCWGQDAWQDSGIALPPGLRIRSLSKRSRTIVAISTSGQAYLVNTDSLMQAFPGQALRDVAIGQNFGIGLRTDSTLVTGGFSINPAPQDRFVAVGAGDRYLVALRKDGRLFVWGTTPIGALLTEGNQVQDAVDFATGPTHMLVQRRNGQVIGIGSQQGGATDIPPGLRAAVQLSAGNNCSAALMADGTVRVWGFYQNGQTLGAPLRVRIRNVDNSNVFSGHIVRSDGTVGLVQAPQITPTEARSLRNVSAIAGLASHIAWLTPQGQLGAKGFLLPVPTGTYRSVTAMSDRSGLALRADGTLISFGQAPMAIPPSLGRVVQVAASTYYAFALRANGTVVALGDTLGRPVAPPRGLANVRAVAAGVDHGLALLADSTVVAWGGNGQGQLNVPPGLGRVVEIAAGFGYSAALRADGSVVVWGRLVTGNGTVPLILPDGLPRITGIRGSDYFLALLYDAGQGPRQSLTGNIFLGRNTDCVQDADEPGLPGRVVVANPGLYYAMTDDAGRYTLRVDSGTYTVEQGLVNSASMGLLQRQLCPANNAGYTTTVGPAAPQATGLDFANSVVACPLPSVTVSANRRRRCFKNWTYITYGNRGAAPLAGAVVHLRMPRFVHLLAASRPYTYTAQDSTYHFAVGDLAPDTSGTISVVDSVACLPGLMGLEQCTQVWITPGIQRCQWPQSFDGSDIVARGFCRQGTPRFVLRNQGQAMSAFRPYRVFADSVLVYESGYFLGAGDSLELYVPNASPQAAYYIEARLDSTSPFGRFAVATASCLAGPTGGRQIGSWFAGASSPVQDIDCQPIRDSYDPNDKQVAPAGLGPDGRIEPGTTLSYRIRFMNKGNDTAFVVRIVDTLSPFLDVSTLQVTGSSHRAQVKLLGQGTRPVLEFLFAGINLPDSTRHGAQRAGGFVSFEVEPRADLPLGTRISNFADIYFDYNDPIRTNTTASTLFRPIRDPGRTDTVVTSLWRNPRRTGFALYPNPGNGHLTLVTATGGTLQVIAADGRQEQVLLRPGTQAQNLSHLAPGVYVLRLNGQAQRYVRQP